MPLVLQADRTLVVSFNPAYLFLEVDFIRLEYYQFNKILTDDERF